MSSTNQIFARNGYGINQLQVKADQHLLAENEKIIEDNQALQLHQSRMEKYITLQVKSKKWPYSSNYLPLQPLETFGSLEDETFEGGRYIMYFKLLILSPPPTSLSLFLNLSFPTS
jgi:hypothetical protein